MIYDQGLNIMLTWLHPSVVKRWMSLQTTRRNAADYKEVDG